MFRNVAAVALAMVLSGAALQARAGQADDVATVSARADAKAATVSRLRSRYESATDRSANDLRLSILTTAMDSMSDADPEAIKAIRARASAPGSVVSSDLRGALDRLDRMDSTVDGLVAALVTADRPISLAAEAPSVDGDRSVSGPMPVPVRAE